MKKALLAFLGIAFICLMVADANASNNHNAKWALHYAGVHNAKLNTCAFSMTNCVTEMVVTGPVGPGRFDVYVMALDTDGIAGSRYGLCCPDGGFFFYGWTNCADLEIATAGWPGCGEGDAQTWVVEQPAGHVTMGILDVYVYAGTGMLCLCDDPRTGFAEWCDGAVPEPFCFAIDTATYPAAFGCVGFGQTGYNPCGIIGVEPSSWGVVKSLYQ
jgi:hypothetical protein